ncbi:hypothetical protein K1719_000329 [Acacia pycnantha]|nr:hypothetical protein K1719_000329 [Acacia pycnantha]
MEKHMNGNGNNHPTAVQLKLGSPANVQKGRALVGRLEMDKNLNKGDVISMIKKGWDDYMILSEVDFDWCPLWIQFHGLPHAAFHCENAIILGNTMGRLVMYESPRLQNKLSQTFIRTKVNINIREPLLTGFWVPRPQRKSIWVSIRYERLLNYCYDCGCIGHEARNYKFLLESVDTEETVVRYGNGLGIPHVKTIEEALVIHDQNWDEAILLWDKPPPAVARQSFNTWTFGAFPKDGNKRDLGEKSAISPPRPPILINAPANIDDTVLVINQSEPQITEVPSCVTPTVQNSPSFPQAMQNSKNKRVTEKDVTAGAIYE